MTNKKWKVGLLGAGYISEAHARALHANMHTELKAVCDLSLGRAERASKLYGIPHVFSSLDDLLNSDVDVVHVLLPPDAHFSTCRRILESGRHALLEKPMGINAIECRELVEIADRKQVKLGVNHNFLFLRGYEKLRRHARDGTLGKLDQVTINWLFPLGFIKFGPFDNWMLREPQNLFFELGPHLVAFMLDLVGPMERVSTDIFKPIDLPGGARTYRRWHVHGVNADTGVDLNLSVLPGCTDRSISVRGHAASSRYDFDRDLYCLDEPSGAGVHFDSFLTAEYIALQYATNGLRNFGRSILGKFKKAPSANPYFESIERSVAAFYQGLPNDLDPRLDGRFGVQVIETCEQIAKHAEFAAPAPSTQAWVVSPPLSRPTALVIGGTGFIGKYVVRALVNRGLGVRVVTRGGRAGQIVLAGLPVELVQGDLADPVFMDEAMNGIDTVYHLAKAEGKNWNDYYTQDVLVTKNIGECALARGVKRFIYTGTIDSYYSADAHAVITSDTPLDPNIARRNLYARSKAACESLLMEMFRTKGLPLIIFRPGIVIGEGCPPAHWGVGMFESDTRVQLWGDGTNKLPFVLVEDVAEALVMALDKPGIEGQAFLLTDAPLLSAREYVDIVSKEIGTKLRVEPTPAWKIFISDCIKEAAKNIIRHPNRRIPSYRDWDSRSHRALYDSSKTKKVLGWSPSGDREDVIQRGIILAVREFMR
ncbi:NAD-dependent epimerase/dehydratase family protein [Methylococcus sp. EFPC2]|uniref:NAD-dependent epimerase/dehydratase family protein n=1 Tax=Methylococcus sp. EFPC2 TaxID=2812648 RepID=UPI001966F192|nr:NAD-dependent epimerase/dehydratase family protein [Methylococcus sp. EFPC2]QSA97293.1 NAD-dependent epimerase/dehydratase family protein [Methylococcus sp. EFPC2]